MGDVCSCHTYGLCDCEDISLRNRETGEVYCKVCNSPEEHCGCGCCTLRDDGPDPHGWDLEEESRNPWT